MHAILQVLVIRQVSKGITLSKAFTKENDKKAWVRLERRQGEMWDLNDPGP